jgi:hypothetical protein
MARTKANTLKTVITKNPDLIIILPTRIVLIGIRIEKSTKMTTMIKASTTSYRKTNREIMIRTIVKTIEMNIRKMSMTLTRTSKDLTRMKEHKIIRINHSWLKNRKITGRNIIRIIDHKQPEIMTKTKGIRIKPIKRLIGVNILMTIKIIFDPNS